MSLEDSMTVMFMVPKNLMKRFQSQANRRSNFDKNQQKLLLQSLCGWADDTKIEKYKEKLKAALDAEGITYTNRFYYLGYNPPFEVFNRRNEVVELQSVSIDPITK
jgi:hypothetical protein